MASSVHLRINTLLLVLVLMTGLAIVALLATRALGGPLDPSAAPASTDGVRQAGTPISSIPFTASAPGRYYVTRDLTVGGSGTSGVTISASDVTLDLNGFTLHGVAGSVDGVLVSGARSGIAIQNGNLRGWFNGIDAQNGSYSHISNVGIFDGGTASNDGGYGLIGGPYSIIEDCRVSNNKDTGILALKVTIRNCSVSANGDDGIRIAGYVHMLDSQVRRNNQANSGSKDVRFTGLDNYVADNALGNIVFDASTSPTASGIVRNTYCDSLILGPNPVNNLFPTGDVPEANLFFACVISPP